jgi:hypothetical protein
VLELSIKPVKPNLTIGEIYFDDAWHPWHTQWELLEIKEFNQEFEVVRDRIIQFYKDEKASCTLESGVTLRKPGRATMTSSDEEWGLGNCKITQCEINEPDKTVKLGLVFDEVQYKMKNENT